MTTPNQNPTQPDELERLLSQATPEHAARALQSIQFLTEARNQIQTYTAQTQALESLQTIAQDDSVHPEERRIAATKILEFTCKLS